jgi:hypothetical protein
MNDLDGDDHWLNDYLDSQDAQDEELAYEQQEQEAEAKYEDGVE